MAVVQGDETGLRHGAIGLPDALASTLSNMAPVEGIFIVLVIVAGAMGTLTPWAFMAGAVGIGLTGWNVAQLARRIPSAGSYVGFAYHGAGAIHPRLAGPAAFTFYLSLAAGPVTLAAVVVFLGSWLQTAASLPNLWWLFISLTVIAVTSPVILRGVVTSAKTALLFFILEAGGLLLISVIILARSGGAVSAPLHAHGGTPGGWGVAGVAVVGYGVYEFVLPSQPPLANTFWAYILTLAVLAAIAAAAAVRLRGPAIARLGHVYTGQDSPSAVQAATPAEAVS